MLFVFADKYFKGEQARKMKWYFLAEMISNYHRTDVPYSRLMRHIIRFREDPGNTRYLTQLDYLLQKYPLVPGEKPK